MWNERVMVNVMREPAATDQAPVLALPLVFAPSAILARLRQLNALDRNNRIWLALAAASAPAFGSTLSVVLWAAFVWAVPSLAFGRFPFRRDVWLDAIAVVCFAYVAVKFASSLAHDGIADILNLVNILVFLAPIFVGIRLRLTHWRTVLDLFILFCGFSAVIAVPIAGIQSMTVGLRADAFCGNPGIFAVMSVLFGSLGALNVASPVDARRWLGVLSYLAMIFCVVASGMRAVWLVVPFTTLVILWVASRSIPRAVFRRGAIASAVVLAAGVLLASGPIVDRVSMFAHDISLMQANEDYDSSTGRRILMLEAGSKAFLESPLTGYGVNGRMDAVRAEVAEEQRRLVPFTHPHNGYLAALLDAGVFGLAALLAVLVVPVVIAVKSPRDEAWRLRVAIGSILTLTYAISGAPGIMFEHDLMNSAFVVTLIILACTIPPERAGGGKAAG
jgi:O-antigen ligase